MGRKRKTTPLADSQHQRAVPRPPDESPVRYDIEDALEQEEHPPSTARPPSKATVRRLALTIHQLTPDERAIVALLYPERGFWRPRTRADCASVPRPCPYIGCRHHLGIDPQPNGSFRLTYGHDDVGQMRYTCSLDLADRGPMTLEQVGHVLGVTRERARQMETVAMFAARRAAPDRDEVEFPEPPADEMPVAG